MNEFQEVARQANELADVDPASWAPFVMNVLLLPLKPSVLAAKKDSALLKLIAVDDDWLAAVAALPHLSARGLADLSGSLTRRGWVSVHEAIEFIEHELAEAWARAHEADALHLHRRGAGMLLARAERKLPGTIERYNERAKTFTRVAHGRFDFSHRAAGWLFADHSVQARDTADRRAP